MNGSIANRRAGPESRGDNGQPRFAEFFSGIGLGREALEPIGWRCVFANDIAPGKAEMYVERFGADDLVVDDVNALDIADLPLDLDLMTASFPCIDLSLAGKRAGLAGKHSGTIWPFLDLVEAQCRRTVPPLLLLENVTGFLTSRGGRDLAAVCERMAGLGYCIDLAVIDARWFTPQSRPRLFVTAWRGSPERPADRPPSRLRPPALRRFQIAHPNLPFVDLAVPEPPLRAETHLVDLLEEVATDDERWWLRERTAEAVGSMNPRHRQRVDQLLAGQRDGVATLFRRRRNGRTVGEVRPDRIAGCLRTPQGGSSVQFLVDCRSGEARIRPLTGREYGRLQGAGDFPIAVGDRQARMGFGDAVCVPAVRWLVEHTFLIFDEAVDDSQALPLAAAASLHEPAEHQRELFAP